MQFGSIIVLNKKLCDFFEADSYDAVKTKYCLCKINAFNDHVGIIFAHYVNHYVGQLC